MLDSWEPYGRGIQKLAGGPANLAFRQHARSPAGLRWCRVAMYRRISIWRVFSSGPIFEFFNTIRRNQPFAPSEPNYWLRPAAQGRGRCFKLAAVRALRKYTADFSEPSFGSLSVDADPTRFHIETVR